MESIWENCYKAESILGIAKDKPFQKLILALLVGNIVFGNFILTLSCITPQGSLEAQVQVWFESIVGYCLFSLYLWLILHSDVYEDCLQWCQRFHEKPVIPEPIWSTQQVCSRIFRKTIFVVPILPGMFIFFESLLLSRLSGRLELPYPVNFPGLPESFYVRAFLNAGQVIMTSTFALAIQLSCNVVYVTLKYVIAAMKLIKMDLTAAKSCPEAFKKAVGGAIATHADLVNRVGVVIRLTRTPVLIFELCNYGLLLNNWIAVFLNPTAFFLGVACDVLFVLYVLICWINEKLMEANDDLRLFIYDLEWYEMKPEHRRSLILMLCMTDNTKFLTVGPFHLISFRELGNVLNAVYRCGLLINDFVA